MLCKLRPALILEVSKEILEFTGTVSNIQNKEPIFTHMVSRAWLLLHTLLQLRCNLFVTFAFLLSSVLALANLICHSLKNIPSPSLLFTLSSSAFASGLGYWRVHVCVL